MQHHTHTAVFTSVSGVVGALAKAISAKPVLLAKTSPGLMTFIINAPSIYASLCRCQVFKCHTILIFILFRGKKWLGFHVEIKLVNLCQIPQENLSQLLLVQSRNFVWRNCVFQTTFSQLL